MITTNYIETIKQIKSEILQSRLLIAKMANKELLLLYFKIGKMISEKSTKEKWGSKIIQKLAKDLQNELNGLRGFSYGSLRKMKLFHEEWNTSINLSNTNIIISQSLTDQFKTNNIPISPLSTNKSNKVSNTICSLSTDKFTAHYQI
ncbi:MAG: DUF1016 N-terminal domain-containing protein [Flavobacteriaceae bacterium]|nr:DUF1016 N-terminal domain-containing protein [Flavobacteriaceae bacterium]